MKKSLLLLLFIAMAVSQIFAQQQIYYPMGYYEAMPGDEMIPRGIIAVDEIQGDGETFYWALLELDQIISPMAKQNGPNVSMKTVSQGTLQGIGPFPDNVFPLVYLAKQYYHSGDNSSIAFQGYSSNANFRPSVWLPATRSGDYLTIAHSIDVYIHIAYTYKKGFLGLGTGFGAYLIKIPSNNLTFTQKWY